MSPSREGVGVVPGSRCPTWKQALLCKAASLFWRRRGGRGSSAQAGHPKQGTFPPSIVHRGSYVRRVLRPPNASTGCSGSAQHLYAFLIWTTALPVGSPLEQGTGVCSCRLRFCLGLTSGARRRRLLIWTTVLTVAQMPKTSGLPALAPLALKAVTTLAKG